MSDSIQVKQPKKFFLDCLLNLIKSIASIYDFITLPFYYYNQKVRALKEDIELIRSEQIDPSDPSSPWRQVNLEPIFDMVNSHIDSFSTYDQMLERSFEVYSDRPCYGYRKILEEKIIKKSDTGKILKQVRLDDYRWVTFAEFNEQIEAAKKGFLLHGIKSGDTVMIFADTRPEWQIASQALLRMNVIVGTMYSTLGTDGIVHSINETQITHIVTQEDIVDKLVALKDRLPTLKTVIYFEPNFKGIRSKSSKIRAGSFEASIKTKNGLSQRFFNQFTSNKHGENNNYTLMNRPAPEKNNILSLATTNHNNKVVQQQPPIDSKKKIIVDNDDINLHKSSEQINHQKMNGIANQHDLKGIISVKSNNIPTTPLTNGKAFTTNSTDSTLGQHQCETTTTTNEIESDINISTTTNRNQQNNSKCATSIEIKDNNVKQQQHICESSDLDDATTKQQTSNLSCISFSYLLWVGRVIDEEKVPPFEKPKKGNVAVIMYTSGSTGTPKGVVISHSNLMATLKSFSYTTKDFVHDAGNNTVAAYLPLAHIFEFCIESMMLFHGVKFGFASPHTLTDKSPGLLPGEKGDLFLLKPTVMIIVPLILDRIVQGVKAVLHSEGYFKENLVGWLIDYKQYWSRYHYKTPLIDKLVCSKIAAALGGSCRYVICGC